MARSRGTEPDGAATIIDVARRSGVSKSTVSNVVHGSAPVAESTREKVLLAIEELGYRPNALARDLKRQRTATIGVVVGDLANPFFGELTKSIEQRTSEAGYAAIICDIHSAAGTDREKVALLREQRVAGILMMYFGGDAKVLDEVRRAAVPIIGVSVLDSRFDCVVTDDAKGAASAVDHLAELGHQRIAYVPGDATEASTLAARLQGWKRALRRHKLARGPIVAIGEQSAIKGTVDLETVLASDDPPTAYFASNDTTALRLIDRLDEAGIRVPQHVSVVGFDDIWIAGLRRVGLTTVRQPVGELAALGVGRLLLRIGQRTEDPALPATQQMLPPTLVRRTTTGPAG